MVMRLAPLALVCLMMMPVMAAAEPTAELESFSLIGGDDGTALRMKRCAQHDLAPEVRIAACKILMSDNVGPYAALRELAMAYEDAGDTHNMLLAYNRVVDDFRDYSGFIMRATYYARTGAYQKALKEISKYSAYGGNKTVALNDTCWVRAVAQEEMPAGLADCDLALTEAPHYAQAMDSRGFILFRLGRMDEALAAYNAALQLKPRMVSALYMRGVIEMRAGNTAGQADVKTALSRDPRVAVVYARYGVAAP